MQRRRECNSKRSIQEQTYDVLLTAHFCHYSNLRTEMAFGKYNRIPNSLLRDPGELDIRPQHAKRSWEFWKRDNIEELESSSASSSLSSLQSFANNSDSSTTSSLSSSASSTQETPSDPYDRLQPDAGAQYPIGSSPNFKKGFSFLPDPPANPDAYKHRAIPAPTLRYDPSTMSLRERRFLGLPYGGTVVVHYLKRNEWFLETALALIGREKFWDTGLDPIAYPPSIPRRPADDPLPPYEDHHGQPDNDEGTQKKEKKITTIPTWNGKGGQVDIVPAQWGSARMYGSPLVKENGYVALGRTVPWDALQKSEEGKYGGLRGSPRQRYADMPENKDTSSSPSLSSSSQESSSSSNAEQSALSSSSESSEAHSHSLSSSLESLSSEASTAPHGHDLHKSDLSEPAIRSTKGGLGIQNPDGAAAMALT